MSLRLSKIERNLVDRISSSWTRSKDLAQPGSLEHEIQFQLGCSYGRAATIANEVRLKWPVEARADAALAALITMLGGRSR